MCVCVSVCLSSTELWKPEAVSTKLKTHMTDDILEKKPGEWGEDPPSILSYLISQLKTFKEM